MAKLKPWIGEATAVKDELRKEGRTRAWLVRHCGIPSATMNGYLAGYAVPPNPVLKLMEQALPALTGRLLRPVEKNSA